jgi:hypothetical protein
LCVEPKGKFEYRNPKFETNSNDQKNTKLETT